MKLTTNYSLKKPEGSDVVNIDDFNYNADTIDTKIKNVENQSNSNKTSISTLQTTISNCQKIKITTDEGSSFNISNGDANECIGVVGKVYTGENITNSPKKASGTWWTIQNYAGANYGHQIATAWHGNEMYYRRINGGTWGTWYRITTTSTLSLLEEQVLELEGQNIENEKKISILEAENEALKEELTQIQTSIASLTSLIATTLEEK